MVGVSRATGAVPDVDLVVRELDDAMRHEPTIAVLAGPASTRTAIALRLAEAGLHLLLEKPVSANLDGLDELERLARNKHLTIAVGYNLRFFPPLVATQNLLADGTIGAVRSARIEVGQYLPDWRPGMDHRASVSAQRSLGGGALLELSHELDYVRWIMGQPDRVLATMAQQGPWDLDVEDSTEIIVTFASGASASIHQDMLQRPPVRTARFVGEWGSVVTDLLEGTVTLHAADGEPRQVGDPTQANVHLTYVEQMTDFLAAVAGTAEPRVTLRDGIGALEMAVAARDASDRGCAISLASRSPGSMP